MPSRTFGTSARYGFNGKERDRDLHSLTAYDYGFRIYNPAIGKFLSVDPLTQSYPWYTPYQFAGNKPIWCIDLDGLEETLPKQQIKIPLLTNVSESTCIGCADRSKRVLMHQGTANLETLKKEYEAWRVNNFGKPVPPQYEKVANTTSQNATTVGQGGFLASKEYLLAKANYETWGKYLPGVSDIDDGLTFIAHIANGEYKAAAFTILFFFPGGDALKPLKKLKGAGKLGGTACMDYADDFVKKYSKKIEEAGGKINKIEINIGNNGVIGTATEQYATTGKHQFIEVIDANGAVKIFDNANPEGILKADYMKKIAGSSGATGPIDGAKIYEMAKKIE